MIEEWTAQLGQAVRKAKLGDREKLDALRRLSRVEGWVSVSSSSK